MTMINRWIYHRIRQPPTQNTVHNSELAEFWTWVLWMCDDAVACIGMRRTCKTPPEPRIQYIHFILFFISFWFMFSLRLQVAKRTDTQHIVRVLTVISSPPLAITSTSAKLSIFHLEIFYFSIDSNKTRKYCKRK